MTGQIDPELKSVLDLVPELAGYDGQAERLGGLTNRVYRLGEYCVRLPGEGTEEYIDRANEAVAARGRRVPVSVPKSFMPMPKPVSW